MLLKMPKVLLCMWRQNRCRRNLSFLLTEGLQNSEASTHLENFLAGILLAGCDCQMNADLKSIPPGKKTSTRSHNEPPLWGPAEWEVDPRTTFNNQHRAPHFPSCTQTTMSHEQVLDTPSLQEARRPNGHHQSRTATTHIEIFIPSLTTMFS